MKQKPPPAQELTYTNTPDPAELSFENRKQRDSDVALAFQFESSENILAVVKEAVADGQRQRRISSFANAARNTLDPEKFINSKLVNRK